MNKIKKATGKLLSLILAAAMCVSLVPGGGITALADDDGLDYGIRKLDEGSTPSTSEAQTYATSYGTAYVKRGDTSIYWATSDGKKDHDTTTFVVDGASSGEAEVYCIQLGTHFEAGDKTEYDLLGWTDSDGITFTQDLIDQIALAQDYIDGLSYSTAIKEGLKQVYIWRILDVRGYEDKMYLDPDDYGHASGISINDQKSIYKAATNYAAENAKRYNCWGRVFSSGTNQDMAQFFCAPNTGYLALEKSSSNTDVTKNNDCYSLAGAVYRVYTDKDCTERARDVDGNGVKLTTDENGNTEAVEMGEGTYYVKETKAATGYMLCGGEYSCSNSTDGVHKVTVTTDNTEDNPATVNCEEIPGNDPAGISLYKIDAETGGEYTQGAASLEGAQFTVKYYDGYYNEGTLPDEATRTWVVETKYDEGKYRAFLLDEYKVSGDKWYYTTQGNVTLPLGTYTVQETLAPTGYLLEGASANSGNWVSENTYTAPVHVAQVTTDGVTVNSFSIGNEPDNEHTAEEAVTRFDITLLKHDSGTQASLGSVEFSLTSKTTGETHYFWTDESGKYTSDAGENPHTYDTDNATDQHSGLWFYGTADESLWDAMTVDDSVGALPYDDYRLDEIKGENNDGREMIHVDITTDEIRYSGYTLDLGTLNNNPAAYIHTDAWASDTGTQLCYVEGDNGDGWVTLYDDVYYYNLTPGARSLSSFVKDFSVSHVIFLIVTTKK